MLRKILVATATISTVFISTLGVTQAAPGNITEVKCSTDSDFIDKSCNQCFIGDKLKQGDHIAELTDKWINNSSSKLLLYKDEQVYPEIFNLAGDKVKIKEKVIGGTLWKYTSDIDSLFDNDLDGYVLNPGKSVNWIGTTRGSSYNIEKNTVPVGGNVAMLVYSISSHAILEDTIAIDETTHKECVLYKSAMVEKKSKGKTSTKTPIKTSIKNATKQTTGPEIYILILAALLMGVFLLKRKA